MKVKIVFGINGESIDTYDLSLSYDQDRDWANMKREHASSNTGMIANAFIRLCKLLGYNPLDAFDHLDQILDAERRKQNIPIPKR